MTITVRLPGELEATLRARLKGDGKAVSEFVREAIAEKMQREGKPKPSAYELGRHVFGIYGSGGPDASTKRKELIREIVRAKHHRR